MLDSEIHDRLKQSGINVLLADVTRELGTIDQDSIDQEEQAKLTYEIWDKVSPINNASAEVMLTRKDVDPSTEIYLLRDALTGKVVYFQPHKAKVSGLQRMNVAECGTCAAEHKREICVEKANARTLNEIYVKLGSPARDNF